MKAAQFTGYRQVEIVDAPMPDFGSAPDDSILVRSIRSSICGSDLPNFWMERPPEAYPLPPGFSGHECIGIVVASKSAKFGEGDRVMSIPVPHNGLAEYFISESDQTIPVPDGLSLNEALMAQPLGTVIWALRKLPSMLHLNVAVLGQGPIGLLMAAMVRGMGARRIIGIDRHQYRLDVSRKMGATHTINVQYEDAPARVAEITGGAGADIVFEAVGHNTETINHAMRLARPEGTVLAFGVPDLDNYPFDYNYYFRRNLKLISSVTSQEPVQDHGLAMDLIARGQIDVRPMISHELPFTEVQRGMEMVCDRSDNALKVVYVFPE